MRFPNLLFGLIAIFFSVTVNAQIQITGYVIDAESKLPLPWVHISIEGTREGTITNLGGRFYLSNLGSNTHLRVSFLGYKTQKIAFPYSPAGEFVISLVPDTTLLNEITINSISAKDLVVEAANNIRKNYPSTNTLLTGFYREWLRGKQNGTIYIAEGNINAIKESYEKKVTKGDVKLIKGRKKEFIPNKERVVFYAGAHIVHRFDFVIQRLDFIKDFDQYEYTFKDQVLSDGRETYIVGFKPIGRSAKFQGELYLDIESKAFIGASFRLSEKGIKIENLSKLGITFEWIRREYNVGYELQNGKWNIKNVWQKGKGFDKVLNDSVTYFTLYTTTDFEPNYTDSFTYVERIQFSDLFLEKVNDFNPDYWETVNTVIPTEAEKQFFGKIENENLKSDPTHERNNKRQKIFKILKNMETDFSFGVSFINDTQFDYQISNADFSVGAQFKNPPALYSIHSNIRYLLGKNMSAAITLGSSLNKMRNDSYGIGLDYRFTTSIETRPLKLHLGVELAGNNLQVPSVSIESVNLMIKGKNLNHPIAASLERKSLAILPSLRTSIELKRRLDFFIMGSYRIPIRNKNMLVFKEMSGFFLTRKTDRIAPNTNGISILVDGIQSNDFTFSLNRLQLTFGITLKFR